MNYMDFHPYMIKGAQPADAARGGSEITHRHEEWTRQ